MTCQCMHMVHVEEIWHGACQVLCARDIEKCNRNFFLFPFFLLLLIPNVHLRSLDLLTCGPPLVAYTCNCIKNLVALETFLTALCPTMTGVTQI